MSESLHYLTATEALKMFRSREISPVELVEAVIARSEVCEPELNAFSHTYFEQAIDAARASEARYARSEPCGTGPARTFSCVASLRRYPYDGRSPGAGDL